MVSFQTAEIYNEDQDNIIGVKVIVSADTGQVIDEIQVTNKTDFEELEARLDSLGDDYVQFADESSMSGSTIDAILANVSELFDINATTLGGFQSDDYAKASHTHQKASITNLYNYDISSSNYNLKLNGTNLEKTATISVKVTNMSNTPVSGHSVVIYKNGSVWASGTTNASGVFSNTFTADSEGITTFAVNNQKTQVSIVKKLESVTYPNTMMTDDRFSSSSKVYFEKKGNLVILTYYLKLAGNHPVEQEWNICTLPQGFLPSDFRYKDSWSYVNSSGMVFLVNNSNIPQLKFMIFNGSTNLKPIMMGQIIYPVEEE